jgi:6-phosphogluconate dehydrogenase
MEIAVIGLGRMGGNIVRRLQRGGHRCVVYDANPVTAAVLASEGATAVASLAEVAQVFTQQPRVIWLMLPAGKITEDTLAAIAPTLSPGDIVIDGGNTFYKDDVRRAAQLKADGIIYVDVGTSGGVWGLERGYCLMIGGDADAVNLLDPIFKTLAPGVGVIERTPHYAGDPRAEQGYIHVGAAGAGHYVKMVHNGIEYGLMQADAEGFDLLKNKALLFDAGSVDGFDLNVADISEVWRRGSVVTSWLLDLCATALAENEELSNYSGVVDDSGEGRWTVQAAVEQGVSAHVLTAALYARFASRDAGNFSEKLLSAMRKGFGGHIETKK